jgi:endonuclease YncB( thermonuclease family)
LAAAVTPVTTVWAAGPRLASGETGVVTRVIDGDSLVLDNGLEVRLAQIEAPRLRAGDPLGPRATAALKSAVEGRTVHLRYGGLRRDKRGRAIAHVFVPQGAGREDLWVQTALLRDGHARVHTYSDNRGDVPALWGAEREARRAGRGVWSSPLYQVRFATPEALRGGEGSFQLMEGKVVDVARRGSVTFINFGADSRTDVTAIVPERAYALFPGGADGLLSLKGRDIRVRGFVRMSNGPSVWLDHPEQVEFVLPAGATAPR